jgi:hypothetical protein
MPNLNTKVYVASKNGMKEESTMRDVLILGRGKAFETLKAMDYFESLVAELKKEQESPLEVLTENARVARKNVEKAYWWWAKGVYDVSLGAPTEGLLLEAQAEFNQAMSILQEANNALLRQEGEQI